MPYTRVDMKNVSLTQISKLPTISGGEVTAEKIKELTHNQSNLLIMQIKRSNSNDLHFILEGKDNQVCMYSVNVMVSAAFCFIFNS